MKKTTTTRLGHGKAAFATAAALLAASSGGATYTFLKNPASWAWDATTPNWSDGATSGVAWTDGADAAFGNSSELTFSVVGPRSAGSVTGLGEKKMTFGDGGSGSLSWTGMFQSGGQVNFDVPLADDGSGLRFNVGGHVFLNKANAHTGGTHFSNTKNTSRVFAFALASDASLGAVPAEPTDNIFADGGYVALYVDKADATVETHQNRTVVIKSGETMKVSPNGTLRIKGVVRGENPDGGSYPTQTRLHASRYNLWQGRTVLDPGAGKENHFGRLFVEGRLELASGVTRATTSTELSSGENLPLYVHGDGAAYAEPWGHLIVSKGAAFQSVQNKRRFQIDAYGHLEIDGGTVRNDGSDSSAMANDNTDSEVMVGLNTPGKLTVKNGGLLVARRIRPTQTTAGSGGEIFLEEGGTVRVGLLWLDKDGQKGVVHFDGGALQSRNGLDGSGNFIQDFANEARWGGVTFSVEKGGAVLDTSNGKNLFFGRPLVSGVAEGETDGGLTARGGNIVVLTDAEHSYNGPTHVETGARVQVRKANALPSGTTLVMGLNTKKTTNIGFNTWADPRTDLPQVVARLEGGGRVYNNSLFKVSGAISPEYKGEFGQIAFEKPCALSCDYELRGDATGCGSLKFENAGMDISGLKLRFGEGSSFDKDAAPRTYKILDAPNGYSGEFDASEIAARGWAVRYSDTAAWLAHVEGFVVVVR